MTDDDPSAQARAARQQDRMEQLRMVYERHVAHFRAAMKQDPLSLAREAHAGMDGLLEHDRRNNPGAAAIRCGKGCSHCCNGPVEIWAQEAALLVEHVRSAGLTLDRARLQRQGQYSVETWREQPAADQACVFLDGEGACRVYEVRPNTCRKLLVTSDPQLCDIGRGVHEGIERWFIWEAEMMESAAMEVFGLRLMPQALLQALRGVKSEA